MQNPAQMLIAEYLFPQNDARILILEGGDGWLAQEASLKVPKGEVLSLDRDVRQVWAANSRLGTLPNANASMEVFSTTHGWDMALLPIPKERKFSRTLLLSAWDALRPGGQLLLAGPSKGGAKAVIKDAERLFGNVVVLGYRNHQRIAACTRGDQLTNPLPKEFQQPGIAPGTQHFLEIKISNRTLQLETHPGIFSWDALDEGTAFLLANVAATSGERVWDIGCGYGVIGLSAALAGASFIAMSDVNLLSIDYARRNAINNGLDTSIQIFPADGLTPPGSGFLEKFDLIISNPAFHQGRALDKSMADKLISTAPDFLNPTGRLALVANRFLNYDKFMQKHFSCVQRIAENNKYHVILASN